MTTLARNARYPLSIPNREGAAAHFLTTSGNLLQIAMPGVVRSEEMAIRKGAMKAGFIKDGPLILWVFTFGSIVLDAPFDSRMIPRADLSLPEIVNGPKRLGVDVHLVDSATMILRGLRRVTLSPRLTQRYLAAVQDQLADREDVAPYIAKYQRCSLADLPRLALVEQCGT